MSLLKPIDGANWSGVAAQVFRHVVAALQDAASVTGAWFRSQRTRVSLEPYKKSGSIWSILTTGLLLIVLAFFCMFYGLMFGLTAPYLIVPLLIPILLLALLATWALPDLRRGPTYGIELLFPATIVVMVLWPDYVALSLPGLPWITFLRLVAFPLTAFLLICLSVSKAFRTQLVRTFRESKLIWLCLAGYFAIELVTLGFSQNIGGSIQGVLMFHITCTAALVVSALLFREPRNVERYFGLLCALGVVIAAVALYEGSHERVPWAGHIPSFLRIPDPSVQIMMSPNFRLYIDKYRVKATFRTPLAMAEFLSLLTPFLLHFAFTKRKLLLRIIAALLIPLNFIVIRMTDSRLGVVGMLSSLLLYGCLWSVIYWRRRPKDLLASAIMYAYPVIFCAVIGLVFASHRMKAMVLGEGAQASSTAARDAQLAMALPKVWANPFGYGAGQCGRVMGFGAGDFITIDNYFITLILDHGILGVLFWYGMFLTGIYMAVKYSISRKYADRPEAAWLAPLGVVLTAFLIIKWVHGQSDNHPIYFMILGMIAGLVYRLKTQTAHGEAAGSASQVKVYRRVAKPLRAA